MLERDGDRGYWDNTDVYKVPAGHYFMMGDNRDNSTDTPRRGERRATCRREPVGRAEIIFFSVDESAGPAGVLELAARRSAGAASSSGSADAVARRKLKTSSEERSATASRIPISWSEALTHASAPQGREGRDNERLEFLGDRVLGLAIAELLGETFPGGTGGRARPRLAGSCAARPAPRSRRWDLGPYLKLGDGEAQAGERAQRDDPGRRLRGAARRHLPRWRLRGGAARSSSAHWGR